MSKTSYVGVNNVARQCKSIYVGVNNTARKVTKAYIGDNNGKARLWWDESGIIASDLPIGQIVKLMEGGVETEFIVVNQGIPENSSLYDASCNGTWLLRKDIKQERVWISDVISSSEWYDNSSVNRWLNAEYLRSLGAIEQGLIKQVKIPYANRNNSVASGANGLSTKIFLVGGYEVGFTTDTLYPIPIDGAKLSYFGGETEYDKRIAYLDGVASRWWLRSSDSSSNNRAYLINANGYMEITYIVQAFGIRPALVLPANSIFDSTTYLLKG